MFLLGKNERNQPTLMHPAIFVSLSVLLGVLFALQEWVSLHICGYHIGVTLLLESWSMAFFLGSILCWISWWWLGPYIQNATFSYMLTRVLPLSILTSVVQNMIWVLCFPNLPIDHPRMDYWHRLSLYLGSELFDSVFIFWCAFLLFRAVGYYQQYREKADAAAQLEVQLAHAQLSALRMQLNPHFFFNTMNSISSLMRSDIDAADTMLEQLGSLLRITLERGDAQLISLRDEVEFIEMYLAMQDKRFVGRIRQSLSVDPELHDAMVPAMILQPIVENAYTHGLSKLENEGALAIDARREGSHLRLSVRNSGKGLRTGLEQRSGGGGVGLANIKSRLQLHYGTDYTFFICEVGRDEVQVAITLPLQVSHSHTEQLTRFGA